LSQFFDGQVSGDVIGGYSKNRKGFWGGVRGELCAGAGTPTNVW